MSQKDMAELLRCNVRTFQRMDAGESKVDIWQFIAISEAAQIPMQDFWILHLETHEFEDYSRFKKLKNLIHAERMKEASVVLAEIKSNLKPSSKAVYLRQYILLAEVELNEDMPREEALKQLDDAIRMTKPKFDETKIKDCRLSYNEVNILIEIAWIISEAGNRDRAIYITKSLIESRQNISASPEDMAHLLPALMSNVATMLGKVERYNESLKYCQMAMDICEEFQEFRLMPKLLYMAASCYRLLGDDKEKWLSYITRAYYCALGNRQYKKAQIIKKDAEDKEKFGIKLRY